MTDPRDIGAGSTVHQRLRAEGVRPEVVSMASEEILEQQSQKDRDAVLPAAVVGQVSVEQAFIGWARSVGPTRAAISMPTFGAPAPLAALQEKFGFTADHGVAAAQGQQAAR